MNEVIHINRIGKAHINDSKSCDDAIYINEDNDVICIADGVSNSSYGGIGARNLVEYIGKRISDLHMKNFLETATVDQIRTTICGMIDNVLASLCEKYKTSNKDAFASTFLACVKTSNSGLTVIHAGDGCVFGQANTQSLAITIISCPDSSSSGKVFSAGHAAQRDRMRVFRLNAKDYKSIMLCTDGFSDPYFDPSSQAFDMTELSTVFQITSNNHLESLVSKYHIDYFNVTDDITCVIYKLTDNSAQNPSLQIPSYNTKNKTSDATAAPIKIDKINNAIVKKTLSNDSIPISKNKTNVNKSKLVYPILIFSAFILLASLLLSFLLLNSRLDKQIAINEQAQKEINLLASEYKELSKSILEIEDKMSETNELTTEESTESSTQANTELTFPSEESSAELLTQQEHIELP